MISALLLAAAAATPPVATDTETPRQPLSVALVSTSAFGLTDGKFFNQLLGARLEYRFTPRFALGAASSYANLEGRAGRVHDVLPEVSALYRVALDGERAGVPLRLGFGYLPRNGPTLRLATGFDFALSRGVALELLPLELMLWVTRERPEPSFDASLSLRFTL